MIYKESNFPNEIDDLLFFSDVRISQNEILNQFNNLISQNKFTEASNYLNSSNLNNINASLFNYFQDAVVKIQTHQLSKQYNNPVISSVSEPSQHTNKHWIKIIT